MSFNYFPGESNAENGQKKFVYAIWTWVFTGFLNSRHGTNWAFSSIQNFHFRKKTDSRSKCWHFLAIPGGFCLKLYKVTSRSTPTPTPRPASVTSPWRSSPPSSVTVEMNIFVAMLIRLYKFDGSQIKFIKTGVFICHNSTDNKIFDPFLSLLRHDHVF